MDYLDQLEAESIYIFREVAAQFERPVILYSGGKDSSVLIHLARKAFYPAAFPFPALHVDTGYKFPEMYEFRDAFFRRIGANILVERNEAAIAAGASPHLLGTGPCCAQLKTKALLEALRKHQFQAAIGGARREEERSRAKERVFSFRDAFGQWDPRNQRPELWNVYNGRIRPGESIRIFPLSNWTETDIWRYIERENIEIVPLYFAQERDVVVRGDQLIPVAGFTGPRSSERVERIMCRFRTLGCTHCTGAFRSTAQTIREIIDEMETVTVSERSTRLIDHDTDGSMEIKKREGYF